jgi:hypothetical protein
MATYQILYWKDIPAQVRVFHGKRPVSKQLPERFQVEIDRVAMSEGLAGSDAYLDQWNWTEKAERVGEVEDLLDEIVSELVTEYEEK